MVSPLLKRYVKLQTGVGIIRGDVCNETFWTDLFAQYNFTHIVHFAARVGVPDSISYPRGYVRTNVECFTSLLEVIANERQSCRVPRNAFSGVR
jgi:UDP-glucose 4-epimerase